MKTQGNNWEVVRKLNKKKESGIKCDLTDTQSIKKLQYKRRRLFCQWWVANIPIAPRTERTLINQKAQRKAFSLHILIGLKELSPPSPHLRTILTSPSPFWVTLWTHTHTHIHTHKAHYKILQEVLLQTQICTPSSTKAKGESYLLNIWKLLRYMNTIYV